MNDIAIRAENLSKQFHIGAMKKNRNIREALIDGFKAPFRRAANLLRGQATGAAELDETFWALKDVSFEIKRGEIVGIIGRNGTGKSTLLKILSRITEPTEGFVDIHGRVGSLLEVGTGFHPELTGRENIYLNGAILGMKKTEIKNKFDEIVAFAEVEKFIDTPVKHYSSGMYMRLAFAVAAYLESEIMFVDEVLAVGDTRFQEKCLTKIEGIGQEGRTVLFVSHNLRAVTLLCNRAILLDDGYILKDDLTHKVVSFYLNPDNSPTAERKWPDPSKAPGGKVTRLRAVRVKTEEGQITGIVDIGQSVSIELEYEVLQPGYMLLPYHHFFNKEGVNIFQAHDTDPAWRKRIRPVGQYVSTVWIPGNFLSEEVILVTSGMTTLYPTIRQFHESEVIAFEVVENSYSSARGDWDGPMGGVVRPFLKWNTQFCPGRAKIRNPVV